MGIGTMRGVISAKLDKGKSKAFLYNLEFLQPCHSTLKIGDLLSESIELLVRYTYGQGSFS